MKEKKVYHTPKAEKVEFNYTDNITASGNNHHGDNGHGNGCMVHGDNGHGNGCYKF